MIEYLKMLLNEVSNEEQRQDIERLISAYEKRKRTNGT